MLTKYVLNRIRADMACWNPWAFLEIPSAYCLDIPDGNRHVKSIGQVWRSIQPTLYLQREDGHTGANLTKQLGSF